MLQMSVMYAGIELASSLVSSTLTTIIVYPAERTKLQMHLNSQIKSTREAIRKIIQRQGVSGLYAGLSSQIFGNGISYAIYFVAYAMAKKILGFNPTSFFSTAKSSGAAGCISALFTNPFWVLKTKQAEKGESIIKAGRNLIRSEGILSLWKGLLASLILVSNPIIQFGVYQFLKKKLNILESSRRNDIIIFFLGMISKIIATLVTYPYTLLRTKQHISTNRERKLTLRQAFHKQLSQNGIKGLYSGLNAKLLQSVLNSALLLMFYEKTRAHLIKMIQQ